MITRLLLVLCLAFSGWSQLLERIEPSKMQPGVYIKAYSPQEDDPTIQHLRESLKKAIPASGLNGWIGPDGRLVFILSRRAGKDSPLDLQVSYWRTLNDPRRGEVFAVSEYSATVWPSATKQDLEECVSNVVQKVKTFERRKPVIVPSSKPMAQIKAQPREGGGAFCLQIKTPVAKEEES